MSECMEVMADALCALARGDAILPLRPVMWLPEREAALAMMPSCLHSLKALGLKAITVFPGNLGTAYESHQGVVLLFEAEHGGLKAIVDASSITAIRTAAVSGVATRILAREDAGDLAILGSGTQARMHLEAMLTARPVGRVRVWSRKDDNARRFAERESIRHRIRVEPMNSAENAVAGADIICTTTSSSEPVLRGSWLSEGAHINAVGTCVAGARELDTEAVVHSALFVDRRESAFSEAGDFLIPKREGVIGDDHVRAEIGEVLTGMKPGRTSPKDITLFKSLGLAIEDLAAAYHVYTRAMRCGAGSQLELGGIREPM
jgi:alanine dehydrogenase